MRGKKPPNKQPNCNDVNLQKALLIAQAWEGGSRFCFPRDAKRALRLSQRTSPNLRSDEGQVAETTVYLENYPCHLLVLAYT